MIEPLRLSARSLAAKVSGTRLMDEPGPRQVPRWDSTGRVAHLYGASSRWEQGKEVRIREFGSTKQWKTISLHEALENYSLRLRDLKGLPWQAAPLLSCQQPTPFCGGLCYDDHLPSWPLH